MKVDNVSELNEVYFELFGRLYENSEFLNEKIFNFMVEKIFECYEDDYSLLALKNDIPYKQEKFTEKFRHSTRIPRRFLLFRNKSEKITRKDLVAEFCAWCKEKDDAYKAQYGGGATTEPTAEGHDTSSPEAQETDEDGRQE